jgi:hypothetical protein
MNNKLKHFRDAMEQFQDQYILIGGNACALLFEAQGAVFRPTEDLDIILVIEKWSKEFAIALWDYFVEGEYESKKFNQQDQKSGNVYRFVLPVESDQSNIRPKQVELFSRLPDDVDLFEGAHLSPITSENGVSNFSAILVDDDFYNYILESVIQVEGVQTVSAICLTVLKARAWLGNRDLLAQGILPVKREGDVHKHALDICRLLEIIDDIQVSLHPKLLGDILEVAKLFGKPEQQTLLSSMLDSPLAISFDNAKDILPQMFVAKEL